MVELEEGPRLLTNLVDVEPDPKALRCDMPVEVVFQKLTDEISCMFQPAKAAAGGARMKDLAKMRELSNSACIVGVDESDEIGTLPGKSMLTLHMEAIQERRPRRRAQGERHRRRLHRRPALAGHHRRGAGHHAALRRRHHGGRLLVHHHGRPRRGGAAPRPLRRGGDLARRVGPIRRGRVSPRRDTALPGQFEAPYGFGGAPTYFGLITTRHMHEYGTTLEQWAQVAVSTRKWAAAQPQGEKPRAHHDRGRARRRGPSSGRSTS